MRVILCFILALGYISAACAQWGVALASGRGVHGIQPYRAALLWNFGALRSVTIDTWRLMLLWETSAGYWDGKPGTKPGSHGNLIALTTGPVIRWHRERECMRMPSFYFEVGLGASWLSHHEIAGRQLSTHFQFEDKVGIGLRFGERQQFDTSLRFIHYSNASIKRPNSGVNMGMFSVSYWF